MEPAGKMTSAKSLKTWWPGTELNRRRQPFQGCALPPELPGHVRNALAADCEKSSLHADCGGSADPSESFRFEADGTWSIIATCLCFPQPMSYSEKPCRESSAANSRTRHSNERHPAQPAKLFTNSTKLLRAIPDGPFAIHGFCSSIHAVPAMSR